MYEFYFLGFAVGAKGLASEERTSLNHILNCNVLRYWICKILMYGRC